MLNLTFLFSFFKCLSINVKTHTFVFYNKFGSLNHPEGKYTGI